MLFTEPKSFKEALAFMQKKEILPTNMSSSELMAAYSPEVRARSLLSARVNNADILKEIKSLITRIVSPEEIQDPVTGEMRPVKPGESMDPATARLMLRQTVQKIGYQPDPDKIGTLQDLTSDTRLNLIVKTNSEMAQGYGRRIADQDPDRLDVMPAQELYRLEAREKPRDWANRWLNAGGKIFAGRMIALKADPVWENLSAFGLPYPPFDFNSGMWVRDVSREEAEDLELLEPGAAAPVPKDLAGFNDDLEVATNDLSDPLEKALTESIGTEFQIIDGVLQRK